jgi:hypothetical protein
MLDTLKVGIPLTHSQYKRIRDIAAKADRWQWVLCNEASGELLFRRISGLAVTDGESFHRELRWDIPNTYSEGCKLSLEFSVPKYWYGQNIRLLHDFIPALKHLKQSLESQFSLKSRACLPDVMIWEVARADICYGWQFPSQRMAQHFLDSLKRLHFPRKKPVIYPTAILFAGNTYSVKFYLKLPEFRSHDMKTLIKAKASLEWVNYCESLAEGVLRYEVTLRQRWLKRQGVNTVADLIQPLRYFEWTRGEPPKDETEKAALIWAATAYHLDSLGVNVQKLSETGEIPAKEHPIKDGLVIEFPALRVEVNGYVFDHQGGSFTFREEIGIVAILQKLLVKVVGENASMQKFDEVEDKLMAVYKPVKAARLVSFWLYVQKTGSSKAKEIFGDQPYYYNKREIKKAGVTLIEPPNAKVVTIADRQFMQNFNLGVPSEYVVNRVDDYRTSENVLNFVPKMSELA